MAMIKNENDLLNAMDLMRLAKTDLMEYEVKASSDGFPKSIPETISAFSNCCGGAIVLGISEKDFHPVSKFDAKTIQAKCAQAARELVDPPSMAEVQVVLYEGSPVVVVNIPEMAARQKPCHVRKLGQLGGSFVRTGDGDHKMTPYEIDRFIENQHKSARNDIAVVPDSTLEDLDERLLASWISRVRSSSFGRVDRMSDEELLVNRRVASVDEDGFTRLTVAGLLAMGSYPQRYFPRLNVVFTSYPTSSKGETDGAGVRFLDTANIDGSIPEMVVSAVNAVSRNMRHGAIVKGALRENVPDYPLAAIREAVANALMHRDYSLDSQGAPVLVDLFPDRLEISNAGGLFGSLTVSALGKKGGTSSRNQFLSRILEDVPYTNYDGSTGQVVENRGSGYPTIMTELERALMGEPIITSNLDEFRIIFRHRKMTDQEGSSYSKRNVEDAILSFFASRESVSTFEIARAAGISTKTAARYINELIGNGLVEGIGSKYSPKRRYRLSGTGQNLGT